MSALRQTLRAAMGLALPRRWLMLSGPASWRAVWLTFDDGPHPEHTPRVLDALAEHDLRATFFVIGENAAQHPALVRRIAAEGHTLGHHSYFHREPRQTSARALAAEIERTGEVLANIVGVSPPMFRPPKGELTAGKMLALWRMGMSVVLWNVDPKDYRAALAEDVRAWFRAHPLKSGDIILLHDAKPNAAAVIGDVAAAVRAKGLSFRQPRRLDHEVRVVARASV